MAPAGHRHRWAEDGAGGDGVVEDDAGVPHLVEEFVQLLQSNEPDDIRARGSAGTPPPYIGGLDWRNLGEKIPTQIGLEFRSAIYRLAIFTATSLVGLGEGCRAMASKRGGMCPLAWLGLEGVMSPYVSTVDGQCAKNFKPYQPPPCNCPPPPSCAGQFGQARGGWVP